jgi:hypothetical protein
VVRKGKTKTVSIYKRELKLFEARVLRRKMETEA